MIENTRVNSSFAMPLSKVSKESVLSRLIRFVCSVRLGVTLLILLGIACLIGMLIVQQNVDGFDRYFADLTPAERMLYGELGFFDIYHAWYFNALLAALSINIVLASIDRFPKSWRYINRPTITVPIRWLRGLPNAALFSVSGEVHDIAAEISTAFRNAGWRSTAKAEKNGTTYVLAQSGAWNRLGAYAVHVALLTIFLGGFLTAQMGSTGQMAVRPGISTNLMFETVVELDQTKQLTKRLPFEIEGTDVQQRLIKKDGPITAGNTIDWITRFTIKDEAANHEASVQMNRPYDYRGYRFFQASFTNVGRARSIDLEVTPADDGEPLLATIPREGIATLDDGTRIAFTEFRGNFRIGDENANEDTTSYQNPAAVLTVTPQGGKSETAFAFGPQMSGIPIASKPVAGYKFKLVDFEKAADAHVLSVQRDPGANVVYVGFVLLAVTLAAVFFFSHQRVWAAIRETEGGNCELVVAGETNRNKNAFDEKLGKFLDGLRNSKGAAERL